jgi:hypothetical protein
VFVARNTGTGFASIARWHDNFCVADEDCEVGDFDGDGKTDIATFLKDSAAGPGDVFVARSTGTAFGTRTRWHDHFCLGAEVCAVGDFNGDGMDDLATFLRGTSGTTYVGVSTGSSFGPGNIWQTSFCTGGEECHVGDFDGDGRADIAVWRPGTGNWLWLTSSSGFSRSAAGSLIFGANTDIPMVK